MIDSVEYNDNIDWDQNADGLGYSLALIDHIQDNYEPSAWASQLSANQITPGAVNNFCAPIINNPAVADISCYGANDGFIVNQISGGTPPLSYSWSNGSTNSLASNLQAGQHTVNITDFYNCTYTESFNIIEPTQLSASFNINNVSSANLTDGSIEVFPSGGDALYSYNWSNGSTSQNLTNVGEGIYSVSITDVNNCSTSFNQLIIDSDCVAFIVQQNNTVISTQVYQVAQYIQSNGIVTINQSVNYYAGDYIELTNDFEVIQGAEFEAKIGGCQ